MKKGEPLPTQAARKVTNQTLHQSANAITRLHYALGAAADTQCRRSLTVSPDQPDAKVIIGTQEASAIKVQRVTDSAFEAATDPARLALREAVKVA